MGSKSKGEVGTGLLHGVRVIEASLLAPSAVGMHFADLGADVIKVEDPGSGDYVRDVGRRPGEAASLLHRQWNRGKRSVTIDLRDPAGVEDFLKLVAGADILIEGMRPGSLERRGLSYERLLQARPDLVFINLSGFGQDGPYATLPSHGPAFEAYAGLAPPAFDDQGRPRVPTVKMQTGIGAAPLYAVMAGLAALTRARATGQPARIDVAQGDAAAYFNAMQINMAVEKSWRESEGLEPLGAGYGMREAGGDMFAGSVLVQYYRTADDRYVLFQAMERKFWEGFVEAIGRPELASVFPAGKKVDHLWGNDAMRAELAAIFASRTQAEWMELFVAHGLPGIPVNSTDQLADDPHFKARAHWLDPRDHGSPILGFPARIDSPLPDPGPAPTLGQHSEEILAGLRAPS